MAIVAPARACAKLPDRLMTHSYRRADEKPPHPGVKGAGQGCARGADGQTGAARSFRRWVRCDAASMNRYGEASGQVSSSANKTGGRELSGRISIERRIRISRPDGGSARCNASRARAQPAIVALMSLIGRRPPPWIATPGLAVARRNLLERKCRRRRRALRGTSERPTPSHVSSISLHATRRGDACGDAAFRIFGYKLSAPNQPGQTLVALAYVGKARDNIVTQVLNFAVPTHIDVQVQGRDAWNNKRIAALLQQRMARIPGVVDAHIQQELDTHEMCTTPSMQARQARLRPDPQEKPGVAQTQPKLWFDAVEPTCGSRQPKGDSGVGAEGFKPALIAAWAANISNGMRVQEG